ncbi:MAG: hypothetical protein CSB33_04705 [Desulfobacterales bacterium]|nr:MAG: hypothetical protein CSB33_04705 [Desulfobacterales bacterium]
MNRILFMRILILYFLFILIYPFFPVCAEQIRFERMWPTLQQPWYFNQPVGIAVDDMNYIYVSDSANQSIRKFASEGQIVGEWKVGDEPQGIAMDNEGFIYVTGAGDCQVHKFTSDGALMTSWGECGADSKTGGNLASDQDGNIYLADFVKIRKFTSDGVLITEWGENEPADVAVGGDGYVYVVEKDTQLIKKYTQSGELLTKWGGDFFQPHKIAVSPDHHVYVADSLGVIRKYTTAGVYEGEWTGFPGNSELFADPAVSFIGDITVDSAGNIYASNYVGFSIRKFSADGGLLKEWSSNGSQTGKFKNPKALATDGEGNLYVADTGNSRIQIFSEDGRFVSDWSGNEKEGFFVINDMAYKNNAFYLLENQVLGAYGIPLSRILKMDSSGKRLGASSWTRILGVWRRLRAIAVGGDGCIYLPDSYCNCIRIYDSDLQETGRMGTGGNGEGQFADPVNIAVDADGYIYVADAGNSRIQKFDGDRRFVLKWGKEGAGDGEFNNPSGIAVDDKGFVYIADAGNNRIQKFTKDGAFVASFGEYGSAPGQFRSPNDICVSANGKIYVADTENNRVQALKTVDLPETAKAVIVAGRLSANDDLWNDTQVAANFAYRTLVHQGFTKNSIYYMSANTDIDLDGNGLADDVDEIPSNSGLERAITEWALQEPPADSLAVYLVDHGRSGTFRISGEEVLSAENLDGWLDALQKIIPGRVIVVYDACYSGSFIPQLTPPEGKERIVITSTSAGEKAYFMSQGAVSFSAYFWTHIFNGINVKDTFDLAGSAIEISTKLQHPVLSAKIGQVRVDENELKNIYIGNGTIVYGEAPVIGSVSPHQTIVNGDSAFLCAEGVTDGDGIARVWAVIRPPDFQPDGSAGTIRDLPSVELLPVGNDRYEGTWDGFTSEGTYQVAVYARDGIGNMSIPKLTTVSAANPLKRRAIIAAGGGSPDLPWRSIRKNADLAYNALAFQGYSDDEIYFMSPFTFSTGVDVLSTKANMAFAITSWAAENTRDIVLYMIGNGGHEVFEIRPADGDDPAEIITAGELGTWLDKLQDRIPGKVTVVYDACRSGSFLKKLVPPGEKERIVIAGSGVDEPACFLNDGQVSFSSYFWNGVLNGGNCRGAFKYAGGAVLAPSGNRQNSEIDDNGNGVGNEKSDGHLAEKYTIGYGIMVAGSGPIIGLVSPEQTLNGDRFATIRAKKVTSGEEIERVWAVIMPPDLEMPPDLPLTHLPVIDLAGDSSGGYAGIYGRFITQGEYTVMVYAMDAEGAVSMPSLTRVRQTAAVQIQNEKGDINGDGMTNLKDAVTALKISADIRESVVIRTDYAASGADADGNDQAGPEEVIYILQRAAQ